MKPDDVNSARNSSGKVVQFNHVSEISNKAVAGKSGEGMSFLDHSEMKLLLGFAQVILCFVGAYFLASGYLGGGDPNLNEWLSQKAQRGIGMLAFFVGTALWWFDDYF